MNNEVDKHGAKSKLMMCYNGRHWQYTVCTVSRQVVFLGNNFTVGKIVLSGNPKYSINKTQT